MPILHVTFHEEEGTALLPELSLPLLESLDGHEPLLHLGIALGGPDVVFGFRFLQSRKDEEWS